MNRNLDLKIEEVLNDIEFFLNESNQVPIKSNKVQTKKGHDPVEAELGDIEDFLKARKSSDIPKTFREECDDEDDEKCSKKCNTKKKPVEPNEIDDDSDALSEEFLDEEFENFKNEDKENGLDIQTINEELEYIESFVDNYTTFMED